MKPPSSNSHEIDFEIKGADMQYVEIMLDPHETVVSEPGAMMYMEQGVQMKASLGDGSDKHKGVLGSIMGVGKRYFTGEKMFMAMFTNNAEKRHKVSFAGPYPGRIQPVDLTDVGGQIYCQRGAFLCGAKGVALEFGFAKKIGFGLFGGEGFIMQKLTGDGLVFVHASGAIEEKTLEAGEILYIDTGSLVGFQKGMDFDIQVVKGLSNILFAGEDLFLTTLTGPGKVWIQSMPYSKLLGRVSHDIITILANKKG